MENNINYSDLKEGQVFTIGNSPSYPKFKTKDGYIDMRDKIVNKRDMSIYNIRLMDNEEIAKIFNISIEEVENWIREIERLSQ